MKHVKPFFLFVDPKKSASGKQGEASSHGKGFLICRYASFPLHTESKVVRFANVTDQKFDHALSFFFSYIHCTRHVGSAPLTVSQPHIDVHCEQQPSPLPPLFQHRQIAAVEWCGTTRPGLARQKRTQHASSVISKSGVLSAKPSSVFLALLAGKLAEKYIYARMLLFHVSVVNECLVVFHSGPIAWKSN
ncbi:BAK_1a_G0038340.mRNA.1.CDS.1 [Saccharomyces cerevisiae]|nr:BAK_1a_G0038340.mRNA.1.CDS.1 [Saccharomyces cerevisiae]CAI4651482.1 BAI_1a_G0038350.mRNA.1.CDS.1 [Saccharomyces cerevisiae]CAI7248940.1 BAI_1a_G0038350.mRNA.1.CDS.1 [Saccharomyces cerevisiae]CAI7249941.1 BAK_1a_G0038340.mRNA.1.CDS.1 [Saccharomyces cerevisiae]